MPEERGGKKDSGTLFEREYGKRRDSSSGKMARNAGHQKQGRTASVKKGKNALRIEVLREKEEKPT